MPPRVISDRGNFSCGKLLLFLVGILTGFAGATTSHSYRNKSDKKTTVSANFSTPNATIDDRSARATASHAYSNKSDGNITVSGNSSTPNVTVDDRYAGATASHDYRNKSDENITVSANSSTPNVTIDDRSAGNGNSEPGKQTEIPKDRMIKLLTGYEVAHYKNEVEKLRDRIGMPSRASMIQRAITDAENISNSFEERSWALYKLLFLLEDTDDAKDFRKLGGVAVVIQALTSPQAELRAISAWILAKACQINSYIQYEILELDPLPILMKMVQSSIVDESVKALCAVSDIIVDNLDAQDKFYSEYNGALVLQEMMSNSSAHIRLRRKSSFIADLAEFHLVNSDIDDSPFSSHSFLKSLVDIIRSSDFYLQRKGLLTIKKIHPLLITFEGGNFSKNFDLYDALEMMRKELDDLVGEREILGNTFTVLERLHSDVWKLFPERFKRPTSQDQKGHHQREKYPRPNPVEMD